MCDNHAIGKQYQSILTFAIGNMGYCYLNRTITSYSKKEYICEEKTNI